MAKYGKFDPRNKNRSKDKYRKERKLIPKGGARENQSGSDEIDEDEEGEAEQDE